MRRAGRRGERGAETLELVACAGLLAVLTLGAERAVIAARLQAAAEEDARVLARQAAVCDGTRQLSLAAVDPGAAAQGGTAHAIPIGGGLFREVVTIPGPAGLASLGVRPSAAVVMSYEPGCA